MSLTHHLTDPNSPVRKFFADRLGDQTGAKLLRHEFAAAQPGRTIVPPPEGVTARSGLLGPIGAAADYRLRLLLAPAERAFAAARHGARVFGRDIGRRHGAQAAKAFDATVEACLDRLASRLARAEAGRPLPDDAEREVCRCCHVLAWLDTAFRNPMVPSLIEHAVPDPPAAGLESLVADRDVDDTAQLADAARDGLVAPLEPIHKVTVGPTFRLSGEVGGADGDVIVDRSLVEIKTTAKVPSRRDNTQSLDRETLWQLAGYVLLDRDDRYDLDEVAVYLSRQATLVRWPVDWFVCALAGDEATVSQLREDFESALASMRPRPRA